ncbi:MAG: GGDEF domain-containing protein [Bacillota bacterium]|nr:GGDEF domain-containing protein [Bacillota bacterium]
MNKANKHLNLADFYHDNKRIAEDEISLLQEQYRRINLKVQVIMVFVAFCFELMYYFIPESAVTSTFQKFLLKYVLAPFLINMTLHLLALRLNESRLNKKYKNYVVMLTSLFQGYVYVLVHQVFVTINAAFVVIIFLSTVYNDKRLTRMITALSLAGILLSTFVFRYNRDFVLTMDYILDGLVVSFIVIIAYITAELTLKKNVLERTKILNAIQEREKYLHGMMVDELSGLYSRAAYRAYMEKAKGAQDEFCIAMLDIDNFKQINDTYGHPYGDRAIQILGRTLKSYYSEDFIAFRFGGEEFVCVVRADRPHTFDLLNEVKDTYCRACAALLGNERITFSGGIAAFAPPDLISDIMKKADVALYMAKNSGKNKILFHQDEKLNKVDKPDKDDK